MGMEITLTDIMSLVKKRGKADEKTAKSGENKAETRAGIRKPLELSLSAIASVLSRKAIEEQKKETAKPGIVDGNKKYATVKERRDAVSGGYGTISKSYGQARLASYADYSKLFSHIGQFRANSPYSIAKSNGESEMISSSQSYADSQPVDKLAFIAKYFSVGQEMSAGAMVSRGISLEEFNLAQLSMKLDPVRYRLKSSTS